MRGTLGQLHHLWTGPAGVTILLLGGLSCATINSDHSSLSSIMLTPVWTESDWPPEDMPAPPDFQVTPRQAFAIVAASKKLPLKHSWFCFRDMEYYYIADAYGRSINARSARKYGLRVDGVEGLIVPP